MKKNICKVLSVLFVFVFFLTCHAQVDTETPGNSNNEPANADILSVSVDNSQTINNASMSSSSDIDYFRISATAKGVLSITVTGMNNNMIGKVETQLLNTAGNLICQGYSNASIAGIDVPPLEILTNFTGLSGIYYIKITNPLQTSLLIFFQFL